MEKIGAMNVDAFLNGYVECALWSSTDESNEAGGEPFDANYSNEDVAPETLARMREDCVDFIRANYADLIEATVRDDYSDGRAGHDFWLTRNHHGAGYWDRGLGDVGERLTRASHAYGECDLYLGDDKLIHA